MNQEVIERLVGENPKIKTSRDKLEAMQPGSYCIHRSWGFGQISSYDEAQNKLIIDFEEKEGHPMDPVFCIDKLDILDDQNILVRKKTEPDVIAEMQKKDKAGLVIEILKTCDDNKASAAEIENILKRLIGKTYKRWWTQAKKELVKNSDVACPTKKTDPYLLREEPLSPEQEILEEFYYIKQPYQKILLAEKLHNISDDVAEVKQDLPQILETLTECIQEAKQLNQSERLHGMWVRNDLARHLEKDKIVAEHDGNEPDNIADLIEEKVDQLEPTSKSLIRETEDEDEKTEESERRFLADLAAGLPATYQSRFLDLVYRTYKEADKWQEISLNLLKQSSGKFTQECVSFLIDKVDNDEGKALVTSSLDKWLNEQTIKGPVLLWVVKSRNSKKYKEIVESLITPRLLSAVLYAIDNEALQSTNVRRIPLADQLIDDGDLINNFLDGATEETARDLARSLLMSQGFEDLTKKSLLARFIKCFPNIQSLVTETAPQESEALFVSQESFDLRTKEYEHLKNVLIPQNQEAIAVAREHGDLKENSEYKMARQENDTLMARKAQMEEEISTARITDFQDVTTESVGIGSVVELEQGTTGKLHNFTILGAWDGKPEENIISYKTPLGHSLMHHSQGETITLEIDGTEEAWTIKSIKRWADR